MGGVQAPTRRVRDQPRNLDTPRRASSSSSSSSSSTGNTRAIPMHAHRRRRARCVHAPSRARQRSTRARVSLADPSSPRADAARITYPRARRMERFPGLARRSRRTARGVDRGGELRSHRAGRRHKRGGEDARPGQFIQIRTSEEGKPAFIAVASAPGKSAAGAGTLELLVKAQIWNGGERYLRVGGRSRWMASPVMGKGFDLSAVSDRSRAILFATVGSGISPVRALLVSGARG